MRKKFSIQNSIEKTVTMIRIFNIKRTTLISFINRDSDSKVRKNHNKIMIDDEKKIFHHFIRLLLMHKILSIYELVFSLIVDLKRFQNETSIDFFRRWFRYWWKQNNLHKIEIKSLFIIRFEIVQKAEVLKWFWNYWIELKKLNIRKQSNIINFDENEFRIKCFKKQKIMMSENINQFYSINSENKKSMNIIEMIDAAENFFSSSFIIMTNYEIMISWFIDFLFEKIHIILSNADFIFEKIAVKFLKHYIKHSDFNKKSKWKLMFMNNHDNHMISEFVMLANEHNIRSFTFIFHLTHCMQSLDVSFFRQYKHWHQRAIQKTVAESFVDYSLN